MYISFSANEKLSIFFFEKSLFSSHKERYMGSVRERETLNGPPFKKSPIP